MCIFLQQTAQTASASAINDAIRYVNEFLHKMDDPYQMALVTYALTTAMTSSRTEAFTKLYNMKISCEGTWHYLFSQWYS